MGGNAFFDGVNKTFGPRLRSHGIQPQLFGFAWMERSAREFTYLSISDWYSPYKDVSKALFNWNLCMSRVEDPRAFVTDDERDVIVRSARFESSDSMLIPTR